MNIYILRLRQQVQTELHTNNYKSVNMGFTSMKNIFMCLLVTFSAIKMLNGDKILLVNDPQYAQNTVKALEAKNKINQHVVQQDNIISLLKSNITAQEAITRQQINETNFRLENATHRVDTQETKYQQTVQKQEAHEAINHILLTRLSTQEMLNTKLRQNMDNKTKEQNNQSSSNTGTDKSVIIA